RSSESGRTLQRWEIKDAVADATVEIRRAAGFGQIIILMVFLPLFALTGIEGKMFRPMAGAFCFALLSAFILAFTVVPALAGLLLRSRGGQRSPIMDWIDTRYSVVIAFFLQRRWWVLGASILLLLTGSLTFFRLGGEFIPQLYERAIAMQMIRPPSIALDSSVELEKISQRVLKGFPEVKDVFARIGSAEIATDPMGVNLSDCYIMLKPRSEWPEINGAVRSPHQLRRALQQAVEAHVPGQRILMSQPIQLRFNELLEGARADLVLKIYGEDLDKLQHLSRKAASIIASVEGVSGAEPEIRGKVPLLQITPRDEVLRDLGMSRSEILDTVDMGLGGQDTGFLYRGVRRFPVRIRLSNEDRTDLGRLQNLPVGVTDSSTIPLGRLARVRMEQTFSMIKRDSMQRRGAVLINPSGDTQSIVEKADVALEKKLNLPEGYYIQWGGNFKNLQEALARLSIVAPIAFLFVALMIYSAFQDWVRTLLVLSGVPFALVGGVIGLALSGLPFSISAGVGFIALFGIAVLNGVVLMSHYGRLQSLGSTGFALATEGARARLRAVLMTALTDIFGFLPMMVATGLGAEVQRPLATVVVSGIFTSTFVVLILFPVLHSLVEPYLREMPSDVTADRGETES
ncbi:MAG: efflux RND transporter permease subunit, partial [Leptospiraceae bacterium]|nr:efflux RND transporter permease subunit [Leptospiraceae bacterium]